MNSVTLDATLTRTFELDDGSTTCDFYPIGHKVYDVNGSPITIDTEPFKYDSTTGTLSFQSDDLAFFGAHLFRDLDLIVFIHEAGSSFEDIESATEEYEEKSVATLLEKVEVTQPVTTLPKPQP